MVGKSSLIGVTEGLPTIRELGFFGQQCGPFHGVMLALVNGNYRERHVMLRDRENR